MHDPRRHQLAIEWPIGVRYLPITSQPTAQQLPSCRPQMARVGRLERLPLDPFLRLAEQFLPTRPAILGKFEISAIGCQNAGVDEFLIGRQFPLRDRELGPASA